MFGVAHESQQFVHWQLLACAQLSAGDGVHRCAKPVADEIVHLIHAGENWHDLAGIVVCKLLPCGRGFNITAAFRADGANYLERLRHISRCRRAETETKKCGQSSKCELFHGNR